MNVPQRLQAPGQTRHKVHAYERTHPMYNYKPDPCGPVYITVGDGGNVATAPVQAADRVHRSGASEDLRGPFPKEGPYRNFMDEIVPNSTGVTYCQVRIDPLRPCSGSFSMGASFRPRPD